MFWADSFSHVLPFLPRLLPSFLRSLLPRRPFTSLPWEKERLPMIEGTTCQVLRAPCDVLSEVRAYLRTHFGSPPQTPVLDIPEEHLLGARDHIMVIRDATEIIATIRYHYMGILEEEPIYEVDCFCIHPAWRKKGVGDVILTELHQYVNRRGIPHCLFLKEGAALSIFLRPWYRGVYVYRSLTRLSGPQGLHPCVHSCPVEQAYRIMDQCRDPNTVLLRNRETTNQQWVYYKKGIHWIMACAQDTFQWKDGGKMAWITAWLESPSLTDAFREEASLAITDTLFPLFDHVWMNKEWCGSHPAWKVDGEFHWYTYQWTTTLSMDRSYCLMT